MKVNKKTEYAVEALILMAREERVMPISEICAITLIPKKFLEQIFLLLKKRKLVRAIRGTKGGYELAKDKCQISLFDIMLACEDKILLVPKAYADKGVHKFLEPVRYARKVLRDNADYKTLADV